MTERNTEYTHGLSLPDAFTCGQLFAFSGMDGENSRSLDWCGVLTGNPGEIRFTSGDSSDDCILLRFSGCSIGIWTSRLARRKIRKALV